jgi:hypothetical protein
MRVTRLVGEPIIRPSMDNRMGTNINGPSLIEVPSWIPSPRGRFYLYFAHHDGDYIRLAYADAVTGPWQIHEPGALALEKSAFKGHLASPDVIIDDEAQMIRMYYHGCDGGTHTGEPQFTRVVCSDDGLSFGTPSDILGNAYFRVFRWNHAWHAISMPGRQFRSEDGLKNFQEGTRLNTPQMRHCAVLVDNDHLKLVYTNVGDTPERLVATRIDLSGDWRTWHHTDVMDVLAPQHNYEGADCPLEPSVRSIATTRLNELRDPALFVHDGTTYLLYAVAGEAGIALARIDSWGNL